MKGDKKPIARRRRQCPLVIGGILTILTLVSAKGYGILTWRAALPVLVVTCGGCAVRAPRDITNPDPASKIPAIVSSVEEKDLSAVQQLVADLESDDPAVRFYAIGGLKRLTGETFGYQYFVDEDQRAAAVEKWKAWLEGWNAGRQQGAGE
jgi:hypothetical protein